MLTAATLGVCALYISVFVDDIATITVVHPGIVADFLPLSAETALAEVFALVACSATESDTSSRCGEAPVDSPAVISARTISGDMDTSSLIWVA